MLQERLIREEFLKSGQISHYESLRRHKRGTMSPLVAGFHALYTGKSVTELESHYHPLLSKYGYVLKGNLRLFWLLRGVCEQNAQGLLFHPEVRTTIWNMLPFYTKIVREIEDWRCPKGNFKVRYRSLIHHLFCEYKVPDFMDRVWCENDAEAHAFYLDLGKGKPVYGHPYLAKAVLSRKGAHWFRQAPQNCSVVQAVRYAQLRCVRKDKRLFRAVANSFLGKSLENDEFWSAGLRWLANQETVDYTQVRALLHHINYRKFGRFQIGNVSMPLPAPDPDFSFGGRTFASVMKDLREFETTIKMDRSQENTNWMPAPFPDFDWAEHPDSENKQCGFRMVQIVRYTDLVEEGVRQKHCVATYSNACHNGYSSIWSLRLMGEREETPLVTVELNNSNMQIVQVRGKENRLADTFEASLVIEWANQIGAKIPEYALS